MGRSVLLSILISPAKFRFRLEPAESVFVSIAPGAADAMVVIGIMIRGNW